MPSGARYVGLGAVVTRSGLYGPKAHTGLIFGMPPMTGITPRPGRRAARLGHVPQEGHARRHLRGRGPSHTVLVVTTGSGGRPPVGDPRRQDKFGKRVMMSWPENSPPKRKNDR